MGTEMVIVNNIAGIRRNKTEIFRYPEHPRRKLFRKKIFKPSEKKKDIELRSTALRNTVDPGCSRYEQEGTGSQAVAEASLSNGSVQPWYQVHRLRPPLHGERS
jgi:hypothetical protein